MNISAENLAYKAYKETKEADVKKAQEDEAAKFLTDIGVHETEVKALLKTSEDAKKALDAYSGQDAAAKAVLEDAYFAA
jgi:hypothetical protein